MIKTFEEFDQDIYNEEDWEHKHWYNFNPNLIKCHDIIEELGYNPSEIERNPEFPDNERFTFMTYTSEYLVMPNDPKETIFLYQMSPYPFYSAKKIKPVDEENIINVIMECEKNRPKK